MASARLAKLIEQEDEVPLHELSREAAVKVSKFVIGLGAHHDIIEAMERLGGMEQMQMVGCSVISSLLDLCGDDLHPVSVRNNIGFVHNVDTIMEGVCRFMDSAQVVIIACLVFSAVCCQRRRQNRGPASCLWRGCTLTTTARIGLSSRAHSPCLARC
jgi:hypothetical protein